MVTFLTRSPFTSRGVHIPSIICCLTPMSYLLNSTLCCLANFLKIIHNFVYQNPCLISLFVSSLCLLTKLEYVWHILLILMSCETYTPYVGLAGMLLHMYMYVCTTMIKYIIMCRKVGMFSMQRCSQIMTSCM